WKAARWNRWRSSDDDSGLLFHTVFFREIHVDMGAGLDGDFAGFCYRSPVLLPLGSHFVEKTPLRFQRWRDEFVIRFLSRYLRPVEPEFAACGHADADVRARILRGLRLLRLFRLGRV